MRKNVILFIYL